MSEQEPIIQSVNIKGKYLNQEQKRTLIVSPGESKIAISEAGSPQDFKQFHVNDIEAHHETGSIVKIALNNGRTYEVSSQDPHKITQALKNAKNIDLASKFFEQKMCIAPKSINYFNAYNPLKNALNPLQAFVQQQDFQNTPINVEEKAAMSSEQKQAPESEQRYKVAQCFLKSQDWKRDEKTGRVKLLNQEWKSSSSKIIGFVVKKFLTTGSFMGISFPAFAMKPQSILESYAKSLGVAPRLFTGVKDSLERMKNFVSFIFTVSLLHLDIRKPFNPVIGETFQAKIAGGSYYAEQISHHPPISAIFFEGDGYKIYGQLQLSASIGLNSGQGRFIGDITVQFCDGYWIKGRIPNGELSGFVVGDTCFQCYGGAYAYDSTNVVCTYQLGKEHIFEGVIGYLRQKYWLKFNEKLKKDDRFIKFARYPQDKYESILSKFTVKIGFSIHFDGQQSFNFDNPHNFPYIPQEIDDPKLLLRSDSRFREDIRQRKENNLQQAQKEKDIIEEEQRRCRKLRQKRKK